MKYTYISTLIDILAMISLSRDQGYSVAEMAMIVTHTQCSLDYYQKLHAKKDNSLQTLSNEVPSYLFSYT